MALPHSKETGRISEWLQRHWTNQRAPNNACETVLERTASLGINALVFRGWLQFI